MDWIVYVILGLVQGITEWLPISSSGHLVIIQELFGISLPGLAFEVLLNFATFLAMVIVFRKELLRLVRGFFRYIFKGTQEDLEDFKFTLYIIIGVIPAGVLGLLFEDFIESRLKSLTTIAIALIITGIGLYYISKIKGYRKQINTKDALWVGLFQAIALIPGISRSGATIFASLYRKLDKELAIQYSFFLAIPVSIGTMLLKIDDLFSQTVNLFEYSIAFFVSLFSAIFAIKWFIGVLNRGKLIYFTYYCVLVGSIILIYQFWG
ncbi:UDP pyrophosphate phosphatase [Vulcanibacillus modesticaldus]|uniref:Undecaprenyl-diphosphatase n=1 Tax=Vulcanibacillus modesticaldus TaxID=337097 RepID=A0A1D2YVU3_9BACI|nr:undecaprenyl-diphosphate phosphatase [Vulcanibacillus modesticaldus]OEF99745.1 UDP pyrophosphate phosphatase [Vulcanibacillus modesticaldus]